MREYRGSLRSLTLYGLQMLRMPMLYQIIPGVASRCAALPRLSGASASPSPSDQVSPSAVGQGGSLPVAIILREERRFVLCSFEEGAFVRCRFGWVSRSALGEGTGRVARSTPPATGGVGHVGTVVDGIRLCRLHAPVRSRGSFSLRFASDRPWKPRCAAWWDGTLPARQTRALTIVANC